MVSNPKPRPEAGGNGRSRAKSYFVPAPQPKVLTEAQARHEGIVRLTGLCGRYNEMQRKLALLLLKHYMGQEVVATLEGVPQSLIARIHRAFVVTCMNNTHLNDDDIDTGPTAQWPGRKEPWYEAERQASLQSKALPKA